MIVADYNEHHDARGRFAGRAAVAWDTYRERAGPGKPKTYRVARTNSGRYTVQRQTNGQYGVRYGKNGEPLVQIATGLVSEGEAMAFAERHAHRVGRAR